MQKTRPLLAMAQNFERKIRKCRLPKPNLIRRHSRLFAQQKMAERQGFCSLRSQAPIFSNKNFGRSWSLPSSPSGFRVRHSLRLKDAPIRRIQRSSVESFLAKQKNTERQGFEPWVSLRIQRFSRPPRSATLAPLHDDLH